MNGPEGPAVTTLSLCSGVGELDAAVQRITGIPVGLLAEADPYAARVLAARHPDVPNLGDITGIDWTRYAGTVDRLVAGWPCQGISHNGHRLGLDDPRSGLWRDVTAAIRAIRPAEVFLENVAAIKTRGLPTVAAHLIEVGYDARWTYTTAGSVGAPHSRKRWLCYATPGAGSAVEVPPPPGLPPVAGRMLPTPKASDGPNGGPNQRDGAGNFYLPGIAVRLDDRWRIPELGHDYAPAIHRWEDILGRPAPAPTAADFRGNQRLNPAFTEWVMGYPAGLVTGLDIPRSQMIKLAGNGVVSLQVAAGYQHLGAIQTRPALAVAA